MNKYSLLNKSIKIFGISIITYNLFKRKNRQSIINCESNVKKHNLYLWGNGFSEHTLDYSNFVPHKIDKFYDLNGNDISKSFERLRHVEFGDYFTGIINEKNELFIFITPLLTGDNTIPEDIEVEETSNTSNNENYKLKDLIYSPCNERKGIIKISDNVDQVKFIKSKLFYKNNKGEVFMLNTIIGKINNSHYIKGPQIPEEINISSEVIKIAEMNNIVQIETGIDHILMLDKNGDVWGMGDDSFGQLGLDTFTEERIKQMKVYGNFILRRETRPQKMKIPAPIKKMACGKNHTIMLDINNNVWGTGYNRYLQLSNNELYSEKIIGINKPSLIKSLSYQELNKDSDKTIKKVVDMECSANCSFFIVKEYNKENIHLNTYVYGCGEGLLGTMGINYIKHINDVELLPDLSGLTNVKKSCPIDILNISCGNKHCFALLKNPRLVFLWGNNEYGELGTKDRVFTESPLPMLEEYIIPNKIIKIFAGKNCSGFICEKRSDEVINELIIKDTQNIDEQIKNKRKKKKNQNSNQSLTTENKNVTSSDKTDDDLVVIQNSNMNETLLSNIFKSIKKYI